MLLAGDIGGTKTDLAIFSHEAGAHAPLFQTQVHSADYPNLQAMAAEFLNKAQLPVDSACFDVAGPVINGHAKVTNLPWSMDEASLARDLGLESVHLMNDLEAVATAVPVLRPSDVTTLNVGRVVSNGPIGVIAPGTGLGEAFLTWDGRKYVPHASEGGHCDFAPTDESQIGLLRYLLNRFDHVGVERVCSGIGIPNIYEYLRNIETVFEDPELARLVASSKDPTATIVTLGLSKEHPSNLASATVDMFISILASEAANLALKVMSTGGIYIAGGIPLHMQDALEAKFMQGFKRKGRFVELMSQIPVHIILTRAALLGAAVYGLEHLTHESVAKKGKS